LKYRNRIEYFINFRDLNVYCAKKRKEKKNRWRGCYPPQSRERISLPLVIGLSIDYRYSIILLNNNKMQSR
jgi:hypothetical protein